MAIPPFIRMICGQPLKLRLALLLAAMMMLCSCGYMQLVGQEFKQSFRAIDLQSPLTTSEPEPDIDGVLTGNIMGATPKSSPIAVAAFATSFSAAENRRSDRLATYIRLPEPGPYALFVPAGRYKIVVFADTDRNFVLEPEEFVGRYGRPDTVTIRANQVIADLDITLWKPGAQRFDFPVSLQNLPLRQVRRNVLEFGGTIELDDDIFRRKYGAMGLWQPSDFVEKIGVNLYALKPFDAGKTPVLFVHGINGTPLDWKYLARGLDSRRYQPWFYYYPSGLRLNLVSGLLHEKIRAMQRRYGFEKLVVVAHSMGGLVSRAFINRYAKDPGNDYLQLFVSISTPWGGDKTARVGLNSSPLSVPSWEDVAEGSPFIEELHRQSLPPDLGFYLFFSFGGNRRFHWDANDGTVTLQSQLDLRAKSVARRIEGFYEDHITVLASSDVEQNLNDLLIAGHSGLVPPAVRSRSKKQSTANATGGYLRESSDQGPSTGSKRAVNGPMPAEVKRYVDMLQSVDSGRKTEAARRIYRKRLKHPAIFETAAQELQNGFRVNLTDNAHIDAMAWMCNLLGISGHASYRIILQKVVQETPSRKIRKHALKSMRRLPQ